MWKGFNSLIGILVFSALLLAQATQSDTTSAASEALAMARTGNTERAIEVYRELVRRDSTNMPLLRDYAIVLGWAGEYREAVQIVDKVLELQAEQPDWALRDFASIYLYGDALEDAVETFEDLIDRGDTSEETLVRRALALRWLGRSDDAASAYRSALAAHPTSADAVAGLAYSIADAGDLTGALRQLDAARSVSETAPPVVRARVRILNWMGRHFEAQRWIAGLPASLRDDREILEDRIAAARWGGNPVSAMKDAVRLATLFPTDTYRQMSRDLRTEYGHVMASTFRYSEDVDGLVDRTLVQEAAFHLDAAHSIRAGYQYRWLQLLGEQRTLVRYDAGWTGNVGRRLSFYTTLSSIDYRTEGFDRKLAGDGSVEIAVSDALRVTAGGGLMVMDAFQALNTQVTAPFGFGHISFAPGSRNRFQARYSRFAFSDDIVRDRGDFEYSRTLLAESGVKLKAGWRSNLMWNNAQTPDFFSPQSFQSHLGIVQSEGPISSWLDYSAELAAGWQLEPDIPALHPLQVSGSLVLHPGRHWRTTFSAGRSTSSVDRVMPGQYTYSRWSAAVSMEFRFP